jgi:glycosyltransferase involved in cell wall biosynthesis
MKIIQTNKAYLPLIGGVETTIAGLATGLRGKEEVVVEALVCNGVRSFVAETRIVNDVRVTYLPRWGSVSSLPISPSFPFHLAGLHGDILHVHEPFPLVDLAVTVFPRIRDNFKRIVVTWHSDIVRQAWALKFYRPFIHRFLSQVDCITASSPALIEHSEFLSAYRDRCEVLPLGLDLAWTRDRDGRRDRVAEIRRTYGTPLVLFVGRLVYYKGLQYLIEAMAAVPEAHLVVIGAGPLGAALDRQIASLGLGGRITVLPHLTATELYAYYEACDVFVLPSTERSEAYGLVQIEAMASSKPVVSTEIQTGTTFVNQDGVTGFAVPPRDAAALAQAIARLLHDDALRTRMGKQAEERALREFTTERMIDRTYAIYQRLLAQDTGRGRRK